MDVGYCRVSTIEQNIDLQKCELKKYGCLKFFTDIASGIKNEREGLQKALKYLRSGDSLVVWKLDRLGRSLKELIKTINQLQTRGIGFKSIKENIDTTTSTGRLIFHVFGALAEFEREIIKERTIAGLNSARSRGKKGGRPIKMTDQEISLAKKLHKNNDSSVTEICKLLKISKSTFYRYL